MFQHHLLHLRAASSGLELALQLQNSQLSMPEKEQSEAEGWPDDFTGAMFRLFSLMKPEPGSSIPFQQSVPFLRAHSTSVQTTKFHFKFHWLFSAPGVITTPLRGSAPLIIVESYSE